jgi:hypothetical protein
VKGSGYNATAKLSGGVVGIDALRDALIKDAESALGQGLTAREKRAIEQASRARQTASGRIFDPSSTIQEAQAVIEEDRNRQMQNRGFAQSALGQEAGIQTSDLSRKLQAESMNQDAINQAAQFGASQDMQAQLANQAATNQALSQGLQAGLSQDAQQAQLAQASNLAQAQMDQQAAAFKADAATRASFTDKAQQQQASQFDIGAQMDAERLNEQLRQQGLLGYIDAVARTAQLEDQYTLDPFQAILGRGGGGSLQAGQGVLGSAGYGLQSGPQYLDPTAGLTYQGNMYTNQANMFAANQAADASRQAGLLGAGGRIGAAALPFILSCWVAREVYGPTNPQWLMFREWMFNESPKWFFNLYIEYGERFANWISNKPRIKSVIRKWMDSKIRG